MLTLIRCLIPVLPQWHVKDPSHTAKSAGGRLQLNTHAHLTRQSRGGLTMLSRHGVGTYKKKKNDLGRSSSGKARPQSSQLAEPPWTDSGLKSEVGAREQI